MFHRRGRSRLIAVAVLALFAALLPWQTASAQSDDGGEALEADDRIVGGSVATLVEHPYTVQVIVSTDLGLVDCAGSILRSEWILSAASCVDSDQFVAESVLIVAGDQLRFVGAPGPDAQLRGADEIVVHPDWDRDVVQGYDIALLKLDAPLNMGPMVQPISVAMDAQSDKISAATALGWGITSSGGTHPADGKLRKASMPVFSDASCQSAFSGAGFSVSIPGSRVICAGGTNVDGCQGDGGGPLVGMTNSGEVKLIGISSWGVGCASGTPGVYTEVTFFSDWLFGELPNLPCNGKASTVDIGLGMSPTSGADRIVGTDRVDVFDGGGGADKICGMGGDDRINGGAGNDVIWGHGGEDRLFGNGGNDTIYGGPDADLIIGKGGNDTLRGGDGNDVMKGGTGRDKVFGGNGNDNIQGGEGNDDLRGEAGNDKVKGQNGADTALGGDGDDIVKGGNGRDTVDGQDGDDQVWGKGDDDTVIGGPGNDLLKGGKGIDALDGGAGTDDCDPGGGPGVDTFAGCETEEQ